MQTQYKPFLSGLLLPAAVVIVQPYLLDVWPVILEAVTLNIHEGDIRDLAESNSIAELNVTVSLSMDDFHHLWALCFSILCQRNSENSKSLNSNSFHSISSKINNHSIMLKDDFRLVALQGMKYLLEQGLEHPKLLSAQLIEELLQVMLQQRIKW